LNIDGESREMITRCKGHSEIHMYIVHRVDKPQVLPNSLPYPNDVSQSERQINSSPQKIDEDCTPKPISPSD